MTETPLDAMIARAEARVPLLEPTAAREEMLAGATLVDTRSLDARSRDGVIPGSIHIPRTVLEWRLNPGGASQTPWVPVGGRVVVLCDHGCSSVLAAASLLDLGWDAAHVVGGYERWQQDGLPWQPAADGPLADGELPGMRPPESPA